MFGQHENIYTNIIIEFGIVGYSEQDIIKRGTESDKNLPLNFLFSYPSHENEDMEILFQMMFPDDDHKIPSPKFFSLTLTDEKGNRSFLYCLKFPEKYIFNINEKIKYIEVPLVLYIKSQKEDLESFKQLLYSINQIIINDNLDRIIDDSIIINNYKKIQLFNLLFFLFCLPHTSPHTLVKLQLNKELDNIIKLSNDDINEETIDFYFNSNCEIPCNKNDTDINILFLILDQSIIIKVLLSILTEKQIIFIASQAYLLHLIISTFLKLIFPFKWHNICITVLPKENLELLEVPGSYIFGVLSSTISTRELIDEYKGKIIVDCDTNEIFGYSNLEPYEPPIMQIKKSSEDKKKKDKKKDKEMLEINNLDSNNFTQGKNLIIINKNTIMKYQKEINGIKKKLVFDCDNNIIIDVQKSQLFIDKNDIFIEREEWKWLRKNIQLVRNPELFNLDNIDFQNEKKKKSSVSNEEDNPILPNRSFSYNIQNIILNFILRKLSFQESDFMSVFKKTNLYLEYDDDNKEFENTRGKIIVQNIEETKNQPRSIDNSFNIEYSLNRFKVEKIILKLKNKINNKEEKNEKDINIYEELIKILSDYYKIKEKIENKNNDNEEKNKFINFHRNNERHNSLYQKTRINLGSKKILSKHIKNKKSLLQETSGQNKYILLGFDKDLEDSFQFYSKNGFIYFANQLYEFLSKENIDIRKLIYIDNLNYQIINMMNKIFNEELKEKEDEKEKEDQKEKKEKQDTKITDKKKLREIIGVSIVPENKDEDNNENELDNKSGGSVEIKKDQDYDFAENLFNGYNEVKNKIVNFDDNEYNSFGNLDENNLILNFSNFDFDTEINKEIIKKEENNNINHLMQYYLFLAYYLEKAKNDENSLNFFYENIGNKNLKLKTKENINNENNNEDTNELYEILENENDEKEEKKQKLNKIIIKLYIKAFNYSDKKHRDFPYFSFYYFLKLIDLEELKNYNNLFDSCEEHFQLGLIYKKIIIEKQQVEMKKMIYEKKISKSFKNNNNNNYISFKMENLNDDIEKKQKFLGGLRHSDLNVDNNDKINENISISIIQDLAEIINKELINIENFNTSYEIIEQIFIKFKSNENLNKLFNDLNLINLDNITTKKKGFTFWLNCFNYLILYSIFKEKLILNDENSWKRFFNEKYFNIGGKKFTSNDIQYILFKKPYFFSSAYKVKDYIKKLNIDNLEGDLKLNFEEKEKLIPFILYLPITGFLQPIIYNEDNIENDINKRIKEYLNKNVYIDKNNCLRCYDLFRFHLDICGKDLKKFEKFFKPELYSIIKNKKYKKLIQNKITWQINFDD